jgi:superfamily II DNA/RNA helicase
VESSEAALVESIRRQLRFYERALESLSAGRVLTKRDYRRAFVHEEDREAFQQVLFWDFWIEPSSDRVTAEQIHAEMERLIALRRAAECAPSPKRSMLAGLAAESAEPMLVFTGSAATARDLYAALRPRCRCGVATARDGRSAIDAFTAGAIDVLIATDIGGEGLNLQRAGTVVHYDIPWNPVKLDQRNGRAFRIGQKRPAVKAVYFLPVGDDTRIVATIATKNRIRRRVLRPAASVRPLVCSTIRPRLASTAAAVRFIAAIERRGLSAPEWLERRHKAGLEKLLESMCDEELDGRHIDDLLALAAAERR